MYIYKLTCGKKPSPVPFSQLFVVGSCELHDFPCHNWRQSLGPKDIIVGIKVNHDSEHGFSRHESHSRRI